MTVYVKSGWLRPALRVSRATLQIASLTGLHMATGGTVGAFFGAALGASVLSKVLGESVKQHGEEFFKLCGEHFGTETIAFCQKFLGEIPVETRGRLEDVYWLARPMKTPREYGDCYWKTNTAIRPFSTTTALREESAGLRVR